MKKNLALTAAGIIIPALVFPTIGLCREGKGLYYMFSNKPTVKVFVSDIANSTGEDRADTAGLKQQLEDALSTRKSINFGLVKDKADADIIIDGAVTRYYWSKEDPLDMIMGTAAVVYDVVTTENYAYLEALFKVTDAKSDKILWQQRLKIDLTKRIMSEQESVTLINKKTAKIFMRDCFSKGHSRKQD